MVNYEIMTVPVGMLGTLCHIIRTKQGCVVIDPGAAPEKVRVACDDSPIKAILLTHGHFDHIGAVRALMTEGVQLYIHPDDEELLSDPQKNASYIVRDQITAPAPTGYAVDGGTIEAAGLSFTVMHTPGHTRGSVCYRLDDHLFTGDTVFYHGYGRIDLYGGSEAMMRASLAKLLPILDDLMIYPGHGG